MTLKPMEANYDTLSNDDVVKLLRNMEGRTEFERGMILEAARRIEAQAAAVAAEREAQAKRDEALISLIENDRRIDAETARDYAAAIRARNGAKGE